MQLLDNFDSIFSWGHYRQQEGSLKLTLVQAEPHSMYHSNSTPLESLQYINAFPAPESSKMGKILQMQSIKCQTDGKDCFSKPIIYTPLIQSKTWLGFSAVRGYCWLMLNFSIRTATTFYRATSHLISTQPVLLYCLIHPRFRTYIFLFSSSWVLVRVFLQPANISLNSMLQHREQQIHSSNLQSALALRHLPRLVELQGKDCLHWKGLKEELGQKGDWKGTQVYCRKT